MKTLGESGKKQKMFWGKVSSYYDQEIMRQTLYDNVIQRVVSEIKTDDLVLEVATGTGLVAFETAKRAKLVQEKGHTAYPGIFIGWVCKSII